MRLRRRLIVLLLLVITVLAMPIVANAAVKLNKKTLSLSVGESYRLILQGNKKKVKWKSSNRIVASVSSKGIVKAKKEGKCSIIAYVGKKKYTCKLLVNGFDIKKYEKKVILDNSNVSQFFEWQEIITYDAWGEVDSKQIALKWKYPDWYVIDVTNDFAVEYSLSYDYVWNETRGHLERSITETQIERKVCGGFSSAKDVSNVKISFNRAKGTLTLIHKDAIKDFKYYSNSSPYQKNKISSFVLNDGKTYDYKLDLIPIFK